MKAPDSNPSKRVDMTALGLWMDEYGLPAGEFTEVRLLAGGTQNLLLSFIKGGKGYVLRTPVGRQQEDGYRSIQREVQILTALAGTDVPHPKLIAASTDRANVLGSAFYLMEPIDGFNATVELPAMHAHDPEVRRQMGNSVIDSLGTLSKVDPLAVGLTDYGKIEGFLERQASRWAGQLDSYASAYPAWNGVADLPGLTAINKWLQDNRPQTFTPGIMHGDFHIANVMFERKSPRLAAIIDWELATLGPVLLDLAWLLAVWHEPDHIEEGAPLVVPWEGFPTSRQLIDHYTDVTGISVDDLPWFRVLACYKLAVILEGTFARASAGLAPLETGRDLHARAVRLTRRAERLIRET